MDVFLVKFDFAEVCGSWMYHIECVDCVCCTFGAPGCTPCESEDL